MNLPVHGGRQRKPDDNSGAPENGGAQQRPDLAAVERDSIAAERVGSASKTIDLQRQCAALASIRAEQSEIRQRLKAIRADIALSKRTAFQSSSP